MIYIYFSIGILCGIWFLYKEVYPGLGVGTAILLAPLILLLFAFMWPLYLPSLEKGFLKNKNEK